MNANQIAAEEEHIRSFIKANPDWRKRVSHETRRIHYDYESDILFLRFGKPHFVVMTYMNHDDDEFEWGFEYSNLEIAAIQVMPFRKCYVPRYPKLQAAYDAMCRDWGACDWFINLLPQAETKGASSAAALADVLLECARDPVVAISTPPSYQVRGRL